MASPSSVLLLHGWQNEREPDHWQARVAGRLRERGVEVLHPQLRNPFAPSLWDWADIIRENLGGLTGGDRVVACHSLSCLAWGHLAPWLGAHECPERVCWVAPPGPAFVESEPAIAEFALHPGEEEAIRASSAAEPLRLVCSDDDPYCVVGADVAYGGPLGLDTEVLSGQAHINPDSGYGDWPSMVEWCLDGSIRFRQSQP